MAAYRRSIALTNPLRRKLAMAAAEYDTTTQAIVTDCLNGLIAGLAEMNPKLRKMFAIVDDDSMTAAQSLAPRELPKVDPRKMAQLS